MLVSVVSITIERSLKLKPLADWDNLERGYRFKQKTTYTQYHLGLDVICPSGTVLYAPFNGKTSNNSFPEGGNVLELRANGLVFRFMHLAAIYMIGDVHAGDKIAVTGNTGTLTTGPHLHVDISRNSVQVNNINNFIDPETFNWEGGSMPVNTPEQFRADIEALRKDVDRARTDIDYIQGTRLGGDGGDDIASRVVTLEGKPSGNCSYGFTADDRKLLDKLKTIIKY